MERSKQKLETAIALILVLSFAFSFIAVLPSKGQITSVPDRQTGAYLSVNPKVIGLNQPLTVNLAILPSPTGPQGEHGAHPFLGMVRDGNQTGYDGRPLFGLHFENVSATFTRPDGSTDTFLPLSGSYMSINTLPGMTEESGTLWFIYYPQQVGDWTVQISFPGQSYTFVNYTVYYLPSTSQVVTFTVQEEAVQIGLPPVQLPTGYWKKPISPNNREWYTIGGDWIDNTIFGSFNPYTTAPNTAHILWKKAGQSVAGLVGGEGGSFSYAGGGLSVEYMWGGRIYYTHTHPEKGTQIVCADQYTGDTIWEREFATPGRGGMGLMIVRDPRTTSVSEYSGYPTAELWTFASSGWDRYDPNTGVKVETISPAEGQSCLSPAVWDPTYTYAYCLQTQYPIPPTTLRRSYLNLIGWDISKRGNWNQRIIWNTTLIQPDGTDPGFRVEASTFVAPQAGLVIQGSISGHELWAFDMYTGEQKWHEDLGIHMFFQKAMTSDEKFVVFDSATLKYHCYAVTSTGINELWVTDVQPGMYPWGSVHGGGYLGAQAYDNLYTTGYDGQVECWDLATGANNWNYFIGSSTEMPLGTYSLFSLPVIADGKGYVGVYEHTPTQPVARGAKLYCFDALNGEPIWNISGWFGGPHAVAGGYLMASDTQYTGMTYCFGKGQTETTVTVPLAVPPLGTSVLITGSVLDMSPAQPSTPAISDEDMTVWMNYLHMQDATLINNPPTPKGVEVKLEAYDPNGNHQDIGTITTDSAGNFGKSWNPPVPGDYMVIATFEGSESYWNSYSTAYFSVEEAPEDPDFPDVPTANEIAQTTVDKLPPYPDVPTASEVAQETINRLPAYPEIPDFPDVPTASEVAQETVNQMPETPETPAYLTIDLVILVVAAIGMIIGLLAYMTLRKQ